MFATYEERYDYPASALLATWANPAFLRYKYARLNQQALAIEIVEPREDRAETVVLSVYSAPVAPPGPLRRALPLAVDVQQCDRWWWTDQETLSGKWELRIDELRVIMVGSMTLRPNQTGSLFVVNCQISAALPFGLRGALELLGATTMKRTLKRGAELTGDWLEIHGSQPQPAAIHPAFFAATTNGAAPNLQPQ